METPKGVSPRRFQVPLRRPGGWTIPEVKNMQLPEDGSLCTRLLHAGNSENCTQIKRALNHIPIRAQELAEDSGVSYGKD